MTTKTNDELVAEHLYANPTSYPRYDARTVLGPESILIEIKVTRELAAAMAMQGFAVNMPVSTAANLAVISVAAADALIKELEATK